MPRLGRSWVRRGGAKTGLVAQSSFARRLDPFLQSTQIEMSETAPAFVERVLESGCPEFSPASRWSSRLTAVDRASRSASAPDRAAYRLRKPRPAPRGDVGAAATVVARGRWQRVAIRFARPPSMWPELSDRGHRITHHRLGMPHRTQDAHKARQRSNLLPTTVPP